MRPPDSAAPTPVDDTARRLRALPRRTYVFRVLGMGLAALPIGIVLRELQAGPAAWAWAAFVCLAWPQIAYVLAMRAANPLKAELRNFIVDSILAGSCLPLMHFNLLPSAVLVTVACADKVNTGVCAACCRARCRVCWRRSRSAACSPASRSRRKPAPRCCSPACR